MAYLYADEQFPRQVVELLRSLEHDVLTVQEAGKAGLSDEEVLAFAITQNRAVLTLNRRDFFRLHRLNPQHCGIIACIDDSDRHRMAKNINQAIIRLETLIDQLIRVYRVPPPNL
jgi:predicted nuclease of predicted toxin-antitoxin system